MNHIYVVVDEDSKAYPNAFLTYEEALNEVKRTLDILHIEKGYTEWRDDCSSQIHVKEGHKVIKENKGKDPHITELYLEKGMFICIYRLNINSDFVLTNTRV
jgi:hypothetical protein